MISRRAVVQGASAFLLGGVGLAGYALGVEPYARLSVSGGLGCSAPPLRIGVPPEIVLVDVAA
jgi:predicted MPP superfamily phosphohydrolase